MDLRTTTIDGKIVDIISEDKYRQKQSMYQSNPQMYNSTAVEFFDKDISYILPLRSVSDTRPGIYPSGSIYFVRVPNDNKSKLEYASENLNIIDFNDTSTMKDFLSKNAQIRDMESTILSEIDSVFTPSIGENDSPEMKAFKEAIIMKHIDINKYAPRFGDNFLNDKRILKTGSITMNKLISMCQKLDIEVQLTLRDASDDVINPMSEEIITVLTKQDGDK
nr:MAG TPA: hypothetical protein [Caudoviricetes sp.]